MKTEGESFHFFNLKEPKMLMSNRPFLPKNGKRRVGRANRASCLPWAMVLLCAMLGGRFANLQIAGWAWGAIGPEAAEVGSAACLASAFQTVQTETQLPIQTPRKTPTGQNASPAEQQKPQNRWESHIRRFEETDRSSPPKPGGILFVGSSSIVRWDLKQFFPDLPVINRGFGGSQLADVVYFADRIVLPYQPKIIVLYAGDNDLAAGKTPEQVAADYEAFVKKVHQTLPKTRIIYISIKPSIARWHLIEKIRQANALIAACAGKDDRLLVVDIEKAMLGPDGTPKKELFYRDGLHLSEAGYKIWSDLLRPHLKLSP